MSEFVYEVTRGQWPASVHAGVTKNLHIDLTAMCFNKPLPETVLVRISEMLASSICESMSELIEQEHRRLDEREELFDVAEQAIRRAQDASRSSRKGE